MGRKGKPNPKKEDRRMAKEDRRAHEVAEGKHQNSGRSKRGSSQFGR